MTADEGSHGPHLPRQHKDQIQRAAKSYTAASAAASAQHKKREASALAAVGCLAVGAVLIIDETLSPTAIALLMVAGVFGLIVWQANREASVAYNAMAEADKQLEHCGVERDGEPKVVLKVRTPRMLKGRSLDPDDWESYERPGRAD